MNPIFSLLTALLLAPLFALHAAEPVTIDLAKRTWQGIPGLERTAKGRVFVSWFTGGTHEPQPENTVVLSQSDDGGKTFSAPQAMALPLSDGTRCYDPCLWIDPKGRLWYLFNRSVKDSTRHGVYARICDAPDASPPVWGAEFRVGFDSPFSFRMNKATVLSTGEWVLPVVHALEPLAGWAGFDPKQVFGAAISTDEGKTWKLHGAVKTEKAGLENMIVELKDGRLWMLIRTEKVLWESHSSDKGRTWTPGKPTTIATPHSRFFIRRLASGHLLLVNHHKFTGRSHLTAQLSTDDGATWNDGLLIDERSGVSYPDGVQDKDGLIWITYDRDRGGAGDILLAKFKEEDVIAGKNVSGAVSLKQVVNKLNKPTILPANWNPKAAADKVMAGLVKVTAPVVKGAHDAEFVCVGDRAYVVSEVNDLRGGEDGGWPFIYSTLSIVNLETLKTERVIDFAKGEQTFANETLPVGACWVPRIIQKDANALRCYFVSQDPGKRQSQMWYRDFDLGRDEFAPTIHKAKLKTAAGTFDFQPQHFHADAVTHGFKKKASDSFFFVFDSFKEFDGKLYVALNNFTGQQNALALVHDDLETFEVIGHYNEPQSAALSESAVNRLPDGTWMAICRNDKGNYHFTTSKDGKTWTIGQPKPFVPNGLNSKPTFEKFGGIYHLGWQEATSIEGANRSVFNVNISRDGRTWERKYRFETPQSFQYPAFHEHEGAIWLCVTQGDTDPSRKERIMFGKLEDLPKPAVKVTQELLNSIHVTPKLISPNGVASPRALEHGNEQSFPSVERVELVTDQALGGDSGNSWGGHQSRIVRTQDGLFTVYITGQPGRVEAQKSSGDGFHRMWKLAMREETGWQVVAEGEAGRQPAHLPASPDGRLHVLAWPDGMPRWWSGKLDAKGAIVMRATAVPGPWVKNDWSYSGAGISTTGDLALVQSAPEEVVPGRFLWGYLPAVGAEWTTGATPVKERHTYSYVFPDAGGRLAFTSNRNVPFKDMGYTRESTFHPFGYVFNRMALWTTEDVGAAPMRELQIAESVPSAEYPEVAACGSCVDSYIDTHGRLHALYFFLGPETKGRQRLRHSIIQNQKVVKTVELPDDISGSFSWLEDRPRYGRIIQDTGGRFYLLGTKAIVPADSDDGTVLDKPIPLDLKGYQVEYSGMALAAPRGGTPLADFVDAVFPSGAIQGEPAVNVLPAGAGTKVVHVRIRLKTGRMEGAEAADPAKKPNQPAPQD